jgi:hypothetical protein
MQLTPYWVHANGYAWTRVDFDHRIGGEQTVAMLQPAAVNVSVAGGSLPAGANVRLYSSKTISYSFEAAVSVHAASTGSTRIDDLAPAHYFACVEVGEDEARQRLGETEVDLAANQVTDVTVTIDASKLDVPMVHLYGTLVLPEGVDAASTQLTLWREGAEAARILLKASEMPAVGGDEHVRSWDAGSVRTGTWGAAVRPAMFRQAIVAETPGELRVEIKLPKVFAVSVHVIDADTREPLAPDRIMWSDAAVEGLRQGFNVPVFSLGTKGAYRFEAPSGVVRFMCDLKGYVPYSQEIDLHADVPELQAELHRSAGVHIQVLEGEARLRVGFEFFDGVRVTRPGERRRLGIPAGGTEFELTRLLDPGKYEIQFPALDGYQPIDPVTVDVAAGQLVDVDVHVVRKP